MRGDLQMLDYSVVVPHYNQPGDLRRCLRSLLDQTVSRSSYEIIVVDNNSQTPLDSIRKEFGDEIHLVNEPQQGAAHARNRGMAQAKADLLLFTDADCVVAPNWIEACADSLETSKLCGGAIEVVTESPARRTPTECFELAFAFDQRKYIEEKRFSATANLAVHRDVAAQVGAFRDQVSEDVDWCWRAYDAGFPIVFAANAIVSHPARRCFKELTAKWRRLTREDLNLRREYGFSLQSTMLRQAAVAASPFAHWIRVVRRKDFSLREKTGAVAVLFAVRFYRFGYGMRLLLQDRRAWQARKAAVSAA